jgi:hypothetical protein
MNGYEFYEKRRKNKSDTITKTFCNNVIPLLPCMEIIIPMQKGLRQAAMTFLLVRQHGLSKCPASQI